MFRWRQWFLILIVMLVVSGSSFTAGVATERGGVLASSPRSEPPELIEQFSVFWQAWDLVEKNFVDRSAVEGKNMTYGAIEGMLASLGDTGHTRFLTPEDVAYQGSDLAGHFQGIGAELGQRDNYPIVVAPLDGSPAQKAGIQAGDVVVEVDGQQVAGMSLDRVVRMVRGPEGTTVTLTVLHPGEMSMTQISIVRAKIQIHPVSWAMVPGTKVAHLRISQFTINVNQELLGALKEMRTAGAEAMIVDVRSNSGGILDQAIAVTSQFLTDGNVLLERDARGNRKADAVVPGGLATDLPMVVLVNRGTASAAEIFAGAMQDHQRGKVLGETTFGTGTVLAQFPLSDGSAVWLGISEWLTPNGRQIWKNGIEPDTEVPLAAGVTPLTPRSYADLTSDKLSPNGDAQVMKALELLGK